MLSFMSGSSHIQIVLIGVKYRNCCRILDLLFVIWMGEIQSKLIYIFVTYRLAKCRLQVCNLVFNKFAQAE